MNRIVLFFAHRFEGYVWFISLNRYSKLMNRIVLFSAHRFAVTFGSYLYRYAKLMNRIVLFFAHRFARVTFGSHP